jgi:hypothetical protein
MSRGYNPAIDAPKKPSANPSRSAAAEGTELMTLGSGASPAPESKSTASVERGPFQLLSPLQDIILDYRGPSDDTRSATSVNAAAYEGTLFGSRLSVLALLQHVVRGELAAAEAMIQQNPALLLCEDELDTYAADLDMNHVRVRGTAFRLALGAEDAKYHPEETGMVDMIAYYLDTYYPGEKQKQYKAQFPADDEKHERERNEWDIAALNTVVVAIDGASDDVCELVLNPDEKAIPADNEEAQQLLAALNAFRAHLSPKDKRPIRTGKHFNMQLLIEALELYDNEARYNARGGFDSSKNNLLLRKVIGYIERFVSACDGYTLAQGPYYIVEENEKLKRTFEFPYDRSKKFYPLDLEAGSRLGIDITAGPGGACVEVAAGADGFAPGLRKLCQGKTATMQRIMQQDCSQQPSPSASV